MGLFDRLMVDYVSLRKRIRYYRQKSTMTQENLAEKVDVSLPHMSRIECGKTTPSFFVPGLFIGGVELSRGFLYSEIEARWPPRCLTFERQNVV